MGPKSKDKCHKRQKRNRHAEKTEVEIGVMWAQLRKPRIADSPQKLEEVKCFSPRASRPTGALMTP